MKVKWYGTATLLIEENNTRILVDPYLKKYNPKLPPVPMDEAKTADAIFITHPHLDHFCDIGEFLKAGINTVYVSENGIDRARDYGIPTENMNAISANERIQIGDITVQTYQSRHCKFDLATIFGVLFSPRTYQHFHDGVELLKKTKKFKIEDDIYALEFSGGGKKLMVLGSAGMDENVEYPMGSDMMVFPYQGRNKMHKYMTKFLEAFRPNAVLADHFDDAFPPLTHQIDMKKFEPAVKKSLPEARAIVPVEGEWYEV